MAGLPGLVLAVVLLALGAGATIGTQDTWLDGYGIVAYFLVPLAFIPFAAVAIASPRANRFVESVFTTPVTRRDWFVAKVLVLFTLAAVYYLALVLCENPADGGSSVDTGLSTPSEEAFASGNPSPV